MDTFWEIVGIGSLARVILVIIMARLRCFELVEHKDDVCVRQCMLLDILETRHARYLSRTRLRNI